jgi:hypothetical protein
VVTASALATELRPATVAAWQAYERQVDQRYEQRTGAGRFFARDEFQPSSTWRQEARQGQVAMLQVDAPSAGAAKVAVPDGRIHHWIGGVFVPNATVDGVIRKLRDGAGAESGSYDEVVDSRLLSRDGDRARVFLKLRRQAYKVTVPYNTEHDVMYRPLDDRRATSRSVATKIAELADAGTPKEREKPAGQDSGYLWRLNAYWRYEQADNGVLIECESVSLSRSVPFLFRFFITGIVEGIARDSLDRTLVSLRKRLSG